MNVVIYARFSCKRQTEQSIEGQLKICYEYAAAHNYTVVGEYIDRAQSGTSDNRSDFQRMIADSEKHTFEGVLVYQLDRFARNRYDSAIYKAKLKKNGVRVFSAKENISEEEIKEKLKGKSGTCNSKKGSACFEKSRKKSQHSQFIDNGAYVGDSFDCFNVFL